MSLAKKIINGDVPDDVCHWIVEFRDELNEPDMSPLEAANVAFHATLKRRVAHVTHVRTGLQWFVNMKTREVIEVVEMR
jgi:hypothetical protein